MKIRVHASVTEIEREAWDQLVGEGSPFLEWGWLASLEEAGCVSERTGWLPQHLTVTDGDRIVGACPLYVKSHSQGEFVFDHGWAEGARRGGIPYYPKLLVAAPFTPATGARFLCAPDADRSAVITVLGTALTQICDRSRFSSVHVNFCVGDEVEGLGALGFEQRSGYQFHWVNPGWRTFDDYLTALRSKRRTQVKREQRELDTQGIRIVALTGDEIPDELFAPMFRLYKSTIDKLYWGQQYLNAKLFTLLRERWRHRLCFIVARRGDELVAGTFNVRKNGVLYGRYWGTFEELRYLHFNVCYYAAIDYCLREGIARFEPGAGGEFKHLRGFDARPTTSMHYVRDPRLAHAIREYLTQEREMIARELVWMHEQSALKH